MAQIYKVLGQTNPGAASLTDSYTVPAATEAIISSITVANRSSTQTSFRIAIAPAGAADNLVHYVAYDVVIVGNDVYARQPGFTLAATDKIRVYATLATLTFQFHGSEIT